MLGKEACMKFHVHCTGRWLKGPGIYVSIEEPGILKSHFDILQP